MRNSHLLGARSLLLKNTLTIKENTNYVTFISLYIYILLRSDMNIFEKDAKINFACNTCIDFSLDIPDDFELIHMIIKCEDFFLSCS